MIDTAAKPTCPVCWSTRCLATKANGYRHRWEDGPMAAAHARWKDHRTPPPGPEEPASSETLSLQEPETLSDETLSQLTDETLSEAICAECSSPFTPARATARFCSPACRLRAHRKAEKTA